MTGASDPPRASTGAASPHCPACRFELAGIDWTRCPECGAAVEAPLFPAAVRRAPWPAWAGLVWLELHGLVLVGSMLRFGWVNLRHAGASVLLAPLAVLVVMAVGLAPFVGLGRLRVLRSTIAVLMCWAAFILALGWLWAFLGSVPFAAGAWAWTKAGLALGMSATGFTAMVALFLWGVRAEWPDRMRGRARRSVDARR